MKSWSNNLVCFRSLDVHDIMWRGLEPDKSSSQYLGKFFDLSLPFVFPLCSLPTPDTPFLHLTTNISFTWSWFIYLLSDVVTSSICIFCLGGILFCFLLFCGVCVLGCSAVQQSRSTKTLMPDRSLCVNIPIPSLKGERYPKCIFHHIPIVSNGIKLLVWQ